MNYVDWSIVGVTLHDGIAVSTSDIIESVSLILILALCITILCSWYISNKISNPVTQLEKSMKKVTSGNFDTRIRINSGVSEVVAFTESFNQMVSKIQELIKQNQIEHELKRKMELEALQSQINPHFLYNTLDSIVWMAESKHNDEVILMVNALAGLFRISISGGKRIITLKDELKHAEHYMLIQKNRYTDKFIYETDIQEDTLDLLVPKLMLQPLLENALYHGIQYLMDMGYIRVEAKRVDENLYIRVSDNGIGMSAEKVQNIFNEKTKTWHGVGVNNVNERIKILFGEEYGITFESEIEKGTTVIIKLPKVCNEENINEE